MVLVGQPAGVVCAPGIVGNSPPRIHPFFLVRKVPCRTTVVEQSLAEGSGCGVWVGLHTHTNRCDDRPVCQQDEAGRLATTSCGSRRSGSKSLGCPRLVSRLHFLQITGILLSNYYNRVVCVPVRIRLFCGFYLYGFQFKLRVHCAKNSKFSRRVLIELHGESFG
jgi:hypothetical protein